MTYKNLIYLVSLLLNYVLLLHGMCDQTSIGGEMKCCSEKDSKCYVKAQGSHSRGRTNTICYCDAYCLFTNDCCEDFERTRKLCQGSRACKVSEWSSWRECSSKCGFGVMRRTRKVTVQPANGGKACPALRQTRGCNMNNICDNRQDQTAFILPITFRRQPFGQFLYENILPKLNSKQIENNGLTEQFNQMTPTFSYCVHYKVTYKRSSCQDTWADSLETTVPVCTECQSRVMDGGRCRGEGAKGVRTRWKALGLKLCHGYWVRLGPIVPNCKCQEKDFSNFVFV